ncbi:MAG: hypothetical protein DLM62_17655 [Pseudonocardiales bacterium]|nr:MAG: hypothetical protein DLM62_17655 [Pseudonocardiales bacterium]
MVIVDDEGQVACTWQLRGTRFGGLMDDMDDSKHITQPSLAAVIVARPVTGARRAEQQPTRRHSGGLPDRLRRASRHPAVAGSLATAAGLMLQACIKRAFTPQSGSVGLARSAITPPPSAVTNGRSLVVFSRTVVVETWVVRGHRS